MKEYAVFQAVSYEEFVADEIILFTFNEEEAKKLAAENPAERRYEEMA